MIVHAFAVLTGLAFGQATPPGVQAKPAGPNARPPAIEQAVQIAGAAPIDIGGWLVHLARHQGHLVGRADPRSATLHVLALLVAATEAAPEYPDTYYWLYDLQYRMGRLDAARESLSKYVRLKPGDEAALIRHLEMELSQRQTAEDRAAYVKSQLDRQGLPRAYESELRQWLARLHFERRENEHASREVEKALRLNPMNVAARELAYEMFGETEPSLQRVEMALQLISINPTQANLVWDLAEFLDKLSLHAHAQEWYNRALSLHRRSGTGSIPPEFWHKLAMSYAASGDYAKARQAADAALAEDASFHTARLLRANALRKLGEREAAGNDVVFVLQAYEQQIDAVEAEQRCDEAARIAWFFCYHHPDKDQALKLAQIAMQDPNPGSLARLAYGYALRMNGRTDEAVEALGPLAGVDQLAALERARIAIDRGNKALAMTLLHKAATIQYSGIAYEMIRDLLAQFDETAVQPPLHAKVIAALDRFHRDVFDFYKRPEDFLRFSMRFASEPIPPVGPIDVTFRLENVGPFAITFGEGFMCRPLVALTAHVSGGESKTYKNYLQVLMNSRPMLVPGDAIEKTLAIDVGPMCDHLIRTIMQPQEIELTAMFDPVYEDGELVSGLGTITAEPIKTLLPGVAVSPAVVAGLEARADSEHVPERIFAARIMGALLASAEADATGAAVDAATIDALHAKLSSLLSDTDWRVRAHALTAAGWSRLDPRVTIAAAPAIRDSNGVVKLLAVRLFAQQHGAKFEKVLQQLSKTDEVSYIRIMASSFLPAPVQAQANSALGQSPATVP